MSLKLLAAVVVLQLSTLGLAVAPASCLSGWDWASNSLGQNPCVVAGALEAPCRNVTSYTLGPLNDTTYVPPPKGAALDCECNTVMYSLFMACTACQGVTIEQWSFWDANCLSVFVTQYPDVIPGNTAVPHWAYLNVTVEGTWNATDSRAVGDSPESTATPIPTATVPSGSATGSADGAVSTSLPSGTGSTPPSSKSSSNAGAIAGGVVGGLAALGIIAALVTWFVMRQRRNAPSVEDPINSSRYDYSQTAPYSSSPPPNEPQMKLYNPNDPTSFPDAGNNLPSINTNNSGNVYPSTLYDPAVQSRGKYTGVAEL